MLQKKIARLHRKMLICDKDQQVLETKQIVINALIKIIKKNKKKKEEIEEDIRQIEQIRLFIGNKTEYEMCSIRIDNQMACIALTPTPKINEGAYDIEERLINSNYIALYEILKKYNLICNDILSSEDYKKSLQTY